MDPTRYGEGEGWGVGAWLVQHRFAVQAGLDAATWILAVALATGFRYDFELAAIDRPGVLAVGLVAAVTHVVAGVALGLYVGRWRFGGFDEVMGLARAVAITTAVILVIDLLSFPRLVPLSATVGAGLIALSMTGATRYVWRLVLERRSRPSSDATPVVVFGAGEGGLQVVAGMLRSPDGAYRPVALLDDNPAKQRLSISGVRVEGTRDDLTAVARRHRARAVVLAIPSAGSALVGEITDLARSSRLRVLVVPSVQELFDGTVHVGDVRPVALADLLGRHEIDTDIASIAGYVTGRRVLVTGAGGSIGSELCRQLANFAPAQLVMLDRDESALHAVELALEGRALLDSPNLVVADIRDADTVDDVLSAMRPQVVFHAAALKHLPLLERHPVEAVRANVLGTRNLLAASEAAGVERFVNVSTDKAAAPTSVLGYTKALAERLTADTSRRADGVYLSVRFGNVLGSRGSVLTTFQAQIEAGGPVTVTDPEVSRFFMTTEEAVQLVVQAGALGRDGEVLILDVGAPVRIADLAERLVAQTDRDVRIVFTGLRPGEKVHETLWAPPEVARPGPHPLIAHVTAPGLAADAVEGLLVTREPSAVRDRLADLVEQSSSAPR